MIREDGRKIHPAYLFQAKTPAESSGPWDGLKLVNTTPGDQAFRPLREGGCRWSSHNGLRDSRLRSLMRASALARR